ncbi:MAG: SGNH/GDSL hydrolase family protein [Bdellovibrionota bacterium]
MKMPIRTQWIFALALGLSSSLNAKTQLPQNMAAIGDSITAGALAGFKRTDAHNPLVGFKFLYFLGKAGYMHSLRAFESRSRSWAAGDGSKVLTHARRILKLNDFSKKELPVYNAAVSGSTSYDINEQVSSVLSWSRKELKQGAPDYVLLAIGANDACQDTNEEMTPASAYGNNVRNAVFKVLEANPNAQVFISGIPNLDHLRNVAENSWLGLPPLSTCKDMWALHKFCNNVLLEKDPRKREEVTERLLEYFDEIEAVKAEANARFGSDHVRFGREVYNYNFSDNDISIDCFHPNAKGQQILSDITWKKSWWSNLIP